MPALVRRWIRVGLVLTLIGHALGQGGATGAITGTVEDPSGAVLAGADVRILNQDTGAVARTLKTDANGLFKLVPETFRRCCRRQFFSCGFLLQEIPLSDLKFVRRQIINEVMSAAQ